MADVGTMDLVLFRPGLAWKPRLLASPEAALASSSQVKAATHGLAPAWLGPSRGFCM